MAKPKPRKNSGGNCKSGEAEAEDVSSEEDLEDEDEEEDNDKKEGASLALSGKLAEDANSVKGVEVKYTEPPEARVPKVKWRLYPFKGSMREPGRPTYRPSYTICTYM